MDREQEELRSLGVFGILKESFKMLYKWKKIFTQISLALVLPLAFISLADLQIHDIISDGITGDSRKKTAILWLFRVAVSFAVLTFSLLSTAAVVYTIASIYTSKEVTFKRVMKIVPKVWKRLILTFLCVVLVFFVYIFVAALIFIGWFAIGLHGGIRLATLIILVIIYLVGFVYLTVIWQMANVVTVLEKTYAFRAMMKSKDLVKGKLWTAGILSFLLNLIVLGVNVLFQLFVVSYRDWELEIGVGRRVGWGVLSLALLFVFILLGLVIQTILYFVCKSYHREVINKSELSDHLEVIYLGRPLKSSVQLEQVPV